MNTISLSKAVAVQTLAKEISASRVCMAMLQRADEYPESTAQAILSPAWGEPEAGEVEDWRNHVPINVRVVWRELPLEAKVVAFTMAMETAIAFQGSKP